MHLARLFPLLALAAASPSKRAEPAPLLAPSENAKVIPGKYIVKLKDGVEAEGFSDVVRSLAAEPEHTYDNLFKGFAANLDEAGLKAVRDHPDVDYIDYDQMASGSAFVKQANPPWGLSRISHRRPGSSEYVYDNSAGQGVCAYVIDTGVDPKHPEFGGRAFQLQSFDQFGSNVDNNGHGTHVAGTIGSRTYGVAKKAIILGVKVLSYDNTGPWSAIIKGIDFVSQDAGKRRASCPKGFVVNMSLGGGYIKAANDAVARLVKAGFFVAVAAGNANKDASSVSPASEPSVCTVGGTSIADTRYEMSNWGPVLDILAPAVGVLSTFPGGRTATLTGTSMATPHIAGLGAYLAVLRGRVAGPWLCQEIQRLATANAIKKQVPNTVNLLAFNGAT